MWWPTTTARTSPPAGFASAGITTGELVYEANGTATIDVPATFGLTTGAVLANPFVVTYDGITGGVPDWVDHAPGGVLPGRLVVRGGLRARLVRARAAARRSRDADSGSGRSGADHDGGAGAGAAVAAGRRGGRRQRPGGARPRRVTVVLTRRTGKTRVDRVTTAGDGTFRARLAVRESTRVRAEAEGIRSQELTVVVRSTVRITVRRLASGVTLVRGTTRPALPGRILWLRTTAVVPSRTAPSAAARSRCASPIRLPAATRSSSSRPALAPSGLPRT